MQTIRFRLTISALEYQQYYAGSIKAVVTRSIDGRTVRFPANILQQFLTREGISGEFVMVYDDNNKFQEIKRLR